MIVENSEVVRTRLVELIARVPNVTIAALAENGLQAMALFAEHHPDVVVLDIELPGINGLKLLELMKREQPVCLVIVLTTYTFKELRQRCAALGADYFFDKPTEFERVADVLGALQPWRAGKALAGVGHSQ
jgi:DNA-binding NarL/FixJ family response regulator